MFTIEFREVPKYVAFKLLILLILMSYSVSMAPDPGDTSIEFSQESDTSDFVHSGLAINAALEQLQTWLNSDTGQPPSIFGSGDTAQLENKPFLTKGAAIIERLVSSENILLSFVDAFKQWKSRIGTIVEAKAKLERITSVDLDSVSAVIRFEFHNSTKNEVLSERALFQSTWEWDYAYDSLLLVEMKLLSGTSTRGTGVGFIENAKARGLKYVTEEDARFLPNSDSKLKYQTLRHALGGVSAIDFDGDGDDDLIATSGGPVAVFENNGLGRFNNVTEKVGLGGEMHVSLALGADFDNDGQTELFLGRFIGPNKLYSWNGSKFNDVSANSGLGNVDFVASATALDMNNDGLLDLYLGRYIDAFENTPEMIHYSRNGAPNIMFEGLGNLQFKDISTQSRTNDKGLTLGVAAADWDQDGDTDLYLANDFGRDVLFSNRGDGVFDDTTKASGVVPVTAGLSASTGDVDGDGTLDIYVSGIRSNQRWFSQPQLMKGYIYRLLRSHPKPNLQSLFSDLAEHMGGEWPNVGNHALAGNLLLLNRGGMTFVDASSNSNRPHGWFWSSGFADLDSDGDLDIVALNGWITGAKKHDL